VLGTFNEWHLPATHHPDLGGRDAVALLNRAWHRAVTVVERTMPPTLVVCPLRRRSYAARPWIYL
jgi:hypothetical protein